jgi:hypothetical protein
VPQFWVFYYQDQTIYQLKDEKKDIDVIPAFKQRLTRQDSSRIGSHEIGDKKFRQTCIDLRELIKYCDGPTMVILNPPWNGELIYESFFIIRFEPGT